MSIGDAFVAGGWGMYPTLLAGLALLGVCVRHAVRPEPRFVPLMLVLGLFTLLAGALGFVSGVMAMLGGAGQVPPAQVQPLLLAGTFESLTNVALALLLTCLGTLVAAVGTWRRVQMTPAAAR